MARSSMTWNEFCFNVMDWAAAKGIYENSTYQAQIVGAFNELGELVMADNDEDRVKEAGDVAVYLVNAWFLYDGRDLPKEPHTPSKHFTPAVGCISNNLADANIEQALNSLKGYVEEVLELDFLECCEAAWNKISKRKGRMINGRFVKEEDI